MVDIIEKNTLKGKKLKEYKNYKEHKYRQIAETSRYIYVRSFYPMNKGSSAVRTIIDIRFYKNNKVKDIRSYYVDKKGIKHLLELISFSSNKTKILQVDIHAIMRLFKDFKTHLAINQKGEYILQHLKLTNTLERYGLSAELYLNNKLAASTSYYNPRLHKYREKVAEINGPGYRLTFRILNEVKYNLHGKNYLKKFFRS
ncbi:MAG: hypothetical protein K9W46_00055 [Candidatus Heimdallarchaeum endolithica]|uniref:Uncharacterized protein n=1 Tax=Candidatus Heimdallarchaeum endolithica TaxID=2876572 RepID=A0A9Y1FP47_9ARCH|nr:MAG: hypothetical protein K9W46_00055 [Candidatus Heimdallarchaeum endolithica]